MPKSRSLVGMCRIGNLVGVAKMCKRYIEMYHGPGLVGDSAVYRKGTGAKGNNISEKMLMYELASVFIGDIDAILDGSTEPRKLEIDSVRKLKPILKSQIERGKLQRAIEGSNIDDSATRLFNGVSQLYVLANARKENSQQSTAIDITGEEDMTEEELAAEVNDRDTLFIEDVDATMNAMTFGDVESEELEDAEPKKTVNKFCTVGVDIYSVGWDEIDEMDVKVVRKRAEDRLDRKGIVAKYILSEVKNMKEKASAINIGEANPNPRRAAWRDYERSVRPDYYN